MDAACMLHYHSFAHALMQFSLENRSSRLLELKIGNLPLPFHWFAVSCRFSGAIITTRYDPRAARYRSIIPRRESGEHRQTNETVV